MSTALSLARLLADLDDQLIACMRCGFCQAVCPLYAQTRRETDVARGKLALLSGLAEQMLADAEGVRQRLDRCLLCGSCAAGCPSGVRVLDIFFRARAILTGYLGLPPAQKIILRGLLAHPALFDRLLEFAPPLQRLLSRGMDELLDTSCARLATPLGARHAKRLAGRPAHRAPARRLEPRAGRPVVAMFTGCLIDKLYPRVQDACLAALAHHGYGVELIAGQGCCGMPALSAGDLPTFERLLEHNLALFDPDRHLRVVTACATCAAAIRHLWPLMSAGLPPATRARVAAVAGHTSDISELLADQADPGAAPAAERPVTATYHDPCHLKKSLGVAEAPRRLIKASPAYTLVEMAAPDACCGMGGSFNLKHYDLSAAIGRDKARQIADTGAAVVATGCPACMVQLADQLSQAKAGIAVKHVIELYAEGLRE